MDYFDAFQDDAFEDDVFQMEIEIEYNDLWKVPKKYFYGMSASGKITTPLTRKF